MEYNLLTKLNDKVDNITKKYNIQNSSSNTSLLSSISLSSYIPILALSLLSYIILSITKPKFILDVNNKINYNKILLSVLIINIILYFLFFTSFVFKTPLF
jgi:hypothetical protein